MEQHLQPREEPDHNTLARSSPIKAENYRALSPEAYEAWLARLQQQARKQNRLTRFLTALHFMGVTLYLLLFLAHKTGWLAEMPWISAWIAVTYACAIFGAGAVRSRWRETAQDLGKSADIRAIGPLIEGLNLRDDQPVAQEMLIPLLQRLQASDTSLLDQEQRHILNRFLRKKRTFSWNYRENITLMHAILKAYQQVGDGEAIPYVQTLADGEGYAAWDRSLQEEAQACLIFLRQRAEQQQAQETLLRASSHAD
ncbi:MAG TPA: hypothetical protein VKU00_17655, partial [Chthonomonadaceae bacterium]|nr:hypothetical protein [Chthonomonadaceae bacterium]